MADIHRIRPRSAIVVGAGIVGLSTAWFLQERGVSVTVVDRTGVAAGASWGNAGWIAPALSVPLNDPRTLRYALRSLPNRAAPVRIPLSTDPTLWRFLMRFAANCRESSWTRAVHGNLTLNHECMAAYDVLVSNGVDAPITDAPITALFHTSADAEHLLEQLQRLRDAGQPSSTTELTGAELREQVPLASSEVAVGVRINGQRFVDPGRFVQALARSVVERGGALDTVDVADVRTSGNGVARATRQWSCADGRRGGDRDRRVVAETGQALGSGSGAGRPRLLLHGAGGASGFRADLSAGCAGGVHAVERKAAGHQHDGVATPRCPRVCWRGRCHGRCDKPVLGRGSLGGARRDMGWAAPAESRRASAGGTGAARTASSSRVGTACGA